MGAPIVDRESVIYVQYAVRQIPHPATSIASQLYLLKILPDGTTSTVELSTSTEANLFPGSLMPDSSGGVFATWAIVKLNAPADPEPYRAAQLSSAGAILNTYTMPHAPTTTTTGPYGLPFRPSLVLGEGGTAFAAYGNNVASFSLASGAANWNYDAGSAIAFFGYNAAGGLTLVDSASNQIGISSSGSTDWSFSLAAFSTIRPGWEGYWRVAQPNDGIALAAIEATRMDWGTSEWVTQGGSPAKIGAALPAPFFPWLEQRAPDIGPHEAIYDALDDLIDRLKTDATLQGNAQQFVFDKLTAAGAASRTVEQFTNYLAGQGEYRPNFYDGTKSGFCVSVLKGTSKDCKEGHSGQQVMAELSSDPDKAAIAWTPHYRLFVFFNPDWIGLDAAGRNLGNEALIFHEALHSFMGLQDFTLFGPNLQRALGWPWPHSSCMVNVVIQRDVLQHAAGLDPYVDMPCARPGPGGYPPNP